VKIADKIAYLGRDIEDAVMLKIISVWSLYREIKAEFPAFDSKHLITRSEWGINNTVLIHSFIIDLFGSSSPENGLTFSNWYLGFMKALRKVSNKLIYDSKRLEYSKGRVELIIGSIFNVLASIYQKEMTVDSVSQKLRPYPLLLDSFTGWLVKYTKIDEDKKQEERMINKTIYDINEENQYKKAVVAFIAAMTDNFAIRVFSELIRF